MGSLEQVQSDAQVRVVYRGNTLILEQVDRAYGGRVMVKRLLAGSPPHELEALEVEYEHAGRLSVIGVRKALAQETRGGFPALVLQPVDGKTLREYLENGALGIAERLELVGRLVQVISRLHAVNVTHNELTDSNVLVAEDGQSVIIIDFGSSVSRDVAASPSRTAHVKRESLPYLPPEHMDGSGVRFDCTVDTYSLGVLLYQVLTGQRPFRGSDSRELVHEHAARQPQPPSQLDPSIPEALDSVVLKLLAKDPENRYQSACGLQRDMERCLEQYRRRGAIRPFRLGSADRSGRLRFPETLYGRQSQVRELRALVERAQDGPALILVSGYAGIGKTVLVQQVREPTLTAGGMFVEGKAQQYCSGVPYAVLSSAFRELSAMMLTQTDRKLARWRAAISAALGDGAGALLDIIPGLSRIVETTKEVPFLSGSEAQNRLNYLVRRYLGAVADLVQPLVVFLDDLQWIDPASLQLLEALVRDSALHGLCLVAAYRDNEVDPAHPLAVALNRAESYGARVDRVTLGNLQMDEVQALAADALENPPEVEELGSLLYEKTLGNPFFVKQLLTTLQEANQIRFDLASQRWEWDIESVRALDISENVVDYLASTVGRLELGAQQVLKLAACAGYRFDPALLSGVLGKPVAEITTELGKPETCRLLHQDSGTWRFLHDRIQQAILSLVEDPERSRNRLEIGRRLAEVTPEEEYNERAFEIVDHLNAGVSLVSGQRERDDIARLNLQAARKARDSAAFPSMLRYVYQGMELLGPGSWDTAYRLTLDLQTMAIEAEYLNTLYDDALQRAEAVLRTTHSVLDQIRAYEIAVMCQCACYHMRDATDTGFRALRALGVQMTNSPPPDLDVRRCCILPAMTDPQSLAAMRILTLMFPPTMIAAPELYPSLVFTLVHLSLTHGNCGHSAFAYVLYGMYLCREPEGIPEGSEFGELGLEILRRNRADTLRNRVREIACCFIGTWQRIHLRSAMEEMRELVQSALQTGEIDIAGSQLMSRAILLHFEGEPWESARLELAQNIALIAELKLGFQLKIARVWAQLQLSLCEPQGTPHRLVGEYFDEERMLPHLEHELSLTRYYSYLPLAIYRYYCGDFEGSVEFAQLAVEQRRQLFGFPVSGKHDLYYALAMLRAFPAVGKDTQRRYIETLAPIRRRMKILAEQHSVNFEHDCYLIEAEIARVLGDVGRALGFYDRALSVARRNGFPNFEALGCELAGRFCLGQDLHDLAEHYLVRAHALYQRWGIALKTTELERDFPGLLGHWSSSGRVRKDRGETSLHRGNPDLESALKALRTLSSERNLETLLNRMMGIVMEHAGAERAVLLTRHDDRWIIQATGDFQTRQYGVLLNLPYDPESPEEDHPTLPASVVNLCLRTEQTLVVRNATSDRRFGSDPYVRRHGVKSILCLPLLYQSRLNGALYLENRLNPEAFGQVKIETLQLLCTQFSISFENALLYVAVEEQLRFEKLVSSLSAAFVNLPASQVGRKLVSWLRKLAEFLGVDRGAVYRLDAERGALVLGFTYTSPGSPRPPRTLQPYTWYKRGLDSGRMVIFRRPREFATQPHSVRQRLLDEGIVSYIGVPMAAGGASLGLLELASFKRPNNWSAEIVMSLRLIEEIFAQALMRKFNEEQLHRRTVELRETAKKLKNLTEHLQEVREDERARIAREIHDELGQALTVLRMDTDWVGRHLQEDSTRLAEKLQAMLGLIDSTTVSVQRIAAELRPQILDMLGLFDAVDWLVEEFRRREGISCTVSFEGPEIQEERCVIVLFRIVQEALTNVARHARARRVHVRLKITAERVRLDVRDDGRGITREQIYASNSLGLIGMRERVSTLDGTFDVAGVKGRGTTLVVTLPLEGET